jgi:hypothetical protein
MVSRSPSRDRGRLMINKVPLVPGLVAERWGEWSVRRRPNAGQCHQGAGNAMWVGPAAKLAEQERSDDVGALCSRIPVPTIIESTRTEHVYLSTAVVLARRPAPGRG